MNTEAKIMLNRGDQIEIHYPKSTHVRLWRPDENILRQIVVSGVRDLITDPLTISEFLRRPFLLRSRWLIQGYEPAIRQWRRFYLGSSVEYRSPSILRVGLYETGASRPIKVIGPAFEPTLADRRLMVRAIKYWGDMNTGPLQLKVFADDLRIVG